MYIFKHIYRVSVGRRIRREKNWATHAAFGNSRLLPTPGDVAKFY